MGLKLKLIINGVDLGEKEINEIIEEVKNFIEGLKLEPLFGDLNIPEKIIIKTE